MDKTKFNTSLAVIISVIVIGGFFGLQNLFLNQINAPDNNYNPTPEELGMFAHIDLPTPDGEPEKVVESVFISALSEFDMALMVDEQALLKDYEEIINLMSETYENEI